MDSQKTKDLVRRLFEAAFIQHDLNSVQAMMSSNYKLNDPARDKVLNGFNEWKQAQEIYLRAIPDHRLKIVRQIADGDFVATQWITEGTQKADLPGIPATNRPFSVSGITVSRVVDGKIAEEWQNWDFQGLLEQLNVEPMPKLQVA
jgi:steroid delta-isomerase-like uncharacterized protein